MSTLRIGIIGAGGIVRQRHLPGLLAIEGVKICAVANSTLESSRRFCAEHLPDAKAVADWRDLAKDPEIDIVWVGAPPCLHKPATLAALAAGKHVFCQARMAMNLSDAREMLAAAQAHPDLVTMLCPAPHPGIPFLKKLLEDGVLGEIRMTHLRSLHGAFLDPNTPAHWRQRREISGLNIMTLGIYMEELQRLHGAVSNVQASGKVFIPQRNGYRVETPDMLNVLAEFDNGSLGVFEFSAVHSGEPVEMLEITGSKGVLRHNIAKESFFLHRHGSPLPEVLTPSNEQLWKWKVEEEFIHAVRNPALPPPYPTFMDGVAYMEVVQAVNDSLVSGNRICISSL